MLRDGLAMKRLGSVSSATTILLILSLLTGCVSSIPLTKPSRESTRSVSIVPTVQMPDDLFYQAAHRARPWGSA